MQSLAVVVLCVMAMARAEEQPPPPPFLTGAPADIVKQFFDLIQKDESKTDSEIDADIEAWTAKLGGDYSAKFKAFKVELKKNEGEYEKAHQAAIAKFTPAAKDADAKLTAISDDPKLNGIQKRKQIKALFDGLPKAVKDEIEKAAGPE